MDNWKREMEGEGRERKRERERVDNWKREMGGEGRVMLHRGRENWLSINHECLRKF